MTREGGSPLDPDDPDEPIGAALLRLRRAAGLTAVKLGRMVGMSQPKISRIETGKVQPDPTDVGRLARALGMHEPGVGLLMGRAEALVNRMDDWRPEPIGLAGRQESIGNWESEARALRVFQPAVVVGLLQTSEYARVILHKFHELIYRDGADHTGAAVSARVRRQEILDDPTRHFHFVMMESVLSNRVCPPETMLAQILRIRQVAELPNVTIGIIASDARLGRPPFHGFALMDDRMVAVDLYNTGLTSHGRTDVRLYRQVFDDFAAEVTPDLGGLLDRYQASYAGLLPTPAAGDRAAPRR